MTDTRTFTGFTFPCELDITAVGNSDAALPEIIPVLLQGVGLRIVSDTYRQRFSRHGNYVSVTFTVHCPSRELYELGHATLRAQQSIKYTL